MPLKYPQSLKHALIISLKINTHLKNNILITVYLLEKDYLSKIINLFVSQLQSWNMQKKRNNF